MADLSLTLPLTDGDRVTSQTLHDMIETATLTGLTAADLAKDAQVINVTDTAPDPSLYSYWFDSRHFDPVLRVYARPFNIWLTVGPDRWEIPFRNMAGQTLQRGALVIAASGSSNMTIATGPTLNILGFLQDTCASGAWGPVACHGIGFIDCLVEAAANPGEAVTPLGAAAGQVRNAGFASASNATEVFSVGALLDDLSSVPWTGVSLFGSRAIIWGPKHPSGFGE